MSDIKVRGDAWAVDLDLTVDGDTGAVNGMRVHVGCGSEHDRISLDRVTIQMDNATQGSLQALALKLEALAVNLKHAARLSPKR